MVDEILKAIDELNNCKKVKFKPCDTIAGYISSFEGSAILPTGKEIELCISFKKHFDISMPDIHLRCNYDKYLHVDSKGKLCLFDQSSLMIKRNMLSQLVIDCYDQALEILSIDTHSEMYESERRREFLSYWKSGLSEILYTSFDVEKISYSLFPMLNINRARIVAETKCWAEIIAYDYLRLPKSDSFGECITIRLRNNSVLPPLCTRYKWSIIKNYIMSNITHSQKVEFEKFLRKKVSFLTRYFVLILPSEYSEMAIGFKLTINIKKSAKDSKKKKAKRARSKIIDNCYEGEVEPVHCERLDYSFIQNRLCADDGIRTKSVLILGCGSLGGYIASNLCQYGITSLDILDKDYYSPENACRHWLGFCGESATKIINKADLLKNRLYSMYPYVDVDSLNYEDRSVEAFIEDIARLSRYDLIISALGEPTLNLKINRLLYQNGICTPFVCCFNEPYGIGGHSIVVNLDKDSCLECLYTNSIANEQVAFRGSFVDENQNFLKNMSGCAGSFVPYSNLDSQQTAICVARMAIDVLNGKIVHNTMCSWLGSSDILVNEGYNVSARYKYHKDKGFIMEEVPSNCYCNTCSKE